jgi:hypothetical protein
LVDDWGDGKLLDFTDDSEDEAEYSFTHGL